MKYGSLEWFFSNGGLYLSNKAGAVSKLDFYSYNRLYSVDNAFPSGFLDQIFKRVSNFWEFALTQSVLSLPNDFHSEWLYSIFNIFNIKNIQYSVFVFLLSRYQPEIIKICKGFLTVLGSREKHLNLLSHGGVLLLINPGTIIRYRAPPNPPTQPC